MAEGESLSQHAAAASQQALEMAGVAAEEVDLIILATSSPDDLFGSACQVGHAAYIYHETHQWAHTLLGIDYSTCIRHSSKTAVPKRHWVLNFVPIRITYAVQTRGLAVGRRPQGRGGCCILAWTSVF